MDLSETIDQVARELTNTPIQENLQPQDQMGSNMSLDTQPSSLNTATAGDGEGGNDVMMGSPTKSIDEKLTPQQRSLRSSIISIQNDKLLSGAEKARKIQVCLCLCC